MTELTTLVNKLASLEESSDLGGLRQLREEIVEQYPDSEAAVEAEYRLGLDLLFHARDLDAAIERFAQAAQKKHPFWSAAARTSLGLCFFRQGKSQKALFELRKVAYPEQPTSHSVSALTFIEDIAEIEGDAEEVMRVRNERIKQTRSLVESGRNKDPSERGYYLYSLGVALQDRGDHEEARTVLEDAKNLGPDGLGADLYRDVVALLD